MWNEWSSPVLAAVLGFYAVSLSILWRLVGVYGGGEAIRRGSGKSWRISRIREVEARESMLAYRDFQGIVHTRFLDAELSLPEGSVEVRLVRYFPDAFGTPWHGRLHGKSLIWQGRPAALGFLWKGKCRLIGQLGRDDNGR